VIGWSGPSFATRMRGPHVLVTMPTLRSLESDGSGDVDVQTSERGALALTSSGSGDLTFRGEAGTLDAVVDGSGDLVLAGSADAVTLVSAGHGDLVASELSAGEGTIDCSGSGNLTAQLAGDVRVAASGSGDVTLRLTRTVDTVIVDASSSGDVELAGGARSATLRTSGNGGIFARALRAAEGTIGVAGNGDVEATFTGRVTVSIDGNGDVDLYGDPEVTDQSDDANGELIVH